MAKILTFKFFYSLGFYQLDHVARLWESIHLEWVLCCFIFSVSLFEAKMTSSKCMNTLLEVGSSFSKELCAFMRFLFVLLEFFFSKCTRILVDHDRDEWSTKIYTNKVKICAKIDDLFVKIDSFFSLVFFFFSLSLHLSIQLKYIFIYINNEIESQNDTIVWIYWLYRENCSMLRCGSVSSLDSICLLYQ